MTASFAAEGLVALVPALAIMLGANVGTTLIVQVLSFNVAAVAPVLFVIGLVGIPQRRADADQGSRTGVDRARPDAARAAHPARHAGAGRERAGDALLLNAITGDPVLCIVLAAAADLGRAFERRHRAPDHVARLLAIHHARRRARPRARRQSRQRDQSGDRGRTPRRYGELPAAGGKSAQPAGRRRSGRTVPARPGRGLSRISARPGENDGGIPRRLQRRAGARFHRAARPARLAAGEDISGAQEERRSRGAALSRRERARDALARAGRCGARDAAHGRYRRGDAAASDDGADDQRSRAGRARSRAWTTPSTSSTRRSSFT